ncbi:uncharacterized protein LOC128394443 [Panonychus citri]|uniref:uncharacterized protein LOC128394443 n=1 Tax=Panonychus citri TaxID=50023 RepID=UPI0023070EC3|nr:uncharacterized protein LOC128394443 [Panonychus citri]
MTKLEEQLLIYRSVQRARKEQAEKEARDAAEARKAEEAKKQKEQEKEEQSNQKSNSSLLNFLLPSPSSSTVPTRQVIPPQNRQEPRIAYLRDGNDDDDGMVIDYLDEDEVDFDYNYLDGDEYEDNGRWTKKDYILTFIKFSIYCFLQVMALKAEWGAVFFIVSLLYFIYYNTRTRKRMIGEPSAYSVFNDGCEPIDGAMDANRLINQLTLGQMAL